MATRKAVRTMGISKIWAAKAGELLVSSIEIKISHLGGYFWEKSKSLKKRRSKTKILTFSGWYFLVKKLGLVAIAGELFKTISLQGT